MKKSITAILIFVCGVFLSYGQSSENTMKRADADRSEQEQSSEPIFTMVETMPVFKGDWGEFLSTNVNYPSEAYSKKIQGKVFVRFVVNTDGSVSDVEVAKSIGYGCDEEAIRVIRMTSGAWEPGMQNGKPVKTYFTQPLSFIITK